MKWASFLLAAAASAAQFKYGPFGSKSDEIDLRIPRPPDAYISKRSMRVEVVDPTRQFAQLPALKAAVEQTLQPDFNVAAANPETLFRLTVVTYVRPQSIRSARNENRRVVVGRRPKMRNGKVVLDRNGRPEMEDVYDTRLVPVEYWEGSGRLSARVEALDLTAGGSPLHAMSPSHNFAARHEVAVNRVASPGDGRVLSAPEIDQMLLRAIADSFAPAYKDTFDSPKVLLAVDDELRPINQRALAGDHAGALRDYEAVRMKKPKTEGDRLYNIAVMKEILAYEKYQATKNPDDAQALFLDALQTYDQAMRLDPEEKYIVRARQRLETAKDNFDNAKKVYAAQKLEALKLVAEMEAKRREEDDKRLAEEAKLREEDAKRRAAEIAAANRPDTPQEARFRNAVRLRLRGADPARVDSRPLEAMGAALRIAPADSKRVVAQEIARLGSLAAYRDTFADLVRDKVVTPEERASLNDLAAGMSLLPEDTKPIEAAFQFQEGRPAAVAKPVPPVQRPKPTATPPPAPKPAAQPKPTPSLTPR
jgi:hypothetical protein